MQAGDAGWSAGVGRQARLHLDLRPPAAPNCHQHPPCASARRAFQVQEQTELVSSKPRDGEPHELTVKVAARSRP